ncbi:MAG: DISARM system helicase DrmA [Verrucomicrobiales bacterium]|nr:DISARM system helicase DrmA [Verrucomicrobiales bacterium]
MTSRQVRTSLVEAVQLDLVGPSNDHECTHEVLNESPYTWYLTGYLVPTEAPEEIKFDETSREEVLSAGEAGTDDDTNAEAPPGGKSYLPSSIGLTVMVPAGANELSIVARWGDYTSERIAIDGEAEESGSDNGDDDGEGKKKRRMKTVYRREAREETVAVNADGFASDDLQSFGIPNSGGLYVSVIARDLHHAAALGLPTGARTFTIFLVNYREDEKISIHGCAFQAELEVHSERPLLNQPDLRGSGFSPGEEWDEKLADLQYRGIHDYAVGHGIATEGVEQEESGECHRVKTCWLPQHEVERVAPNTEIDAVEFGMMKLSEVADGDALRSALAPLVEQYQKWIEGEKSVFGELPDARREVAQTALAEAAVAAGRIQKGIDALADDPDALEAFCIANRTIAQAAWQRFRQTDDKIQLEDLKWRPFQLAFILLNLPGLVDEAESNRETVDLLFFPTGGGKTEAYLGLAAFAMVLRRFRNPGVNGCGLSVLMRYTLRLLTLDQLGRAAGLMCALELERERNPKLGEWPFEIGLWVGSAATPNRMGGRKYSGPGKEFTAYAKVNAFRSDTKRPSPIPLESCPWCGEKFDRNSFRLVPNQNEPTNLQIGCVNRKCDFSGERTLPILTVDEPIYRRLPAFLIATVDKFASLPWEGRAGALLGHVHRHDQNGFYGPVDQSKGQGIEGPLPGPDLIIQDELHLISGPLGTIAGLYETAIENLASRKREDGTTLKPKIVASTATVRRADAQIQGLFNRHTAKVFPPPGPDLRDTFFSRTEAIEQSNGRLYLGIAAQGRSLKVILMRAGLALLCAGKKLYDESGGKVSGNPADPYMTMMGYFNSLRELGGSRRIIEDEVVSRAAKYAQRVRREPDVTYFSNRAVDYEPSELTSRVSTNAVARTKENLGNTFDSGERTIDVALATNMISVGLDITRLGLMVVLGQPKGSSEYIQATSRVGRDEKRPGLVVTLLNIHRPRDRSHYEYFQLFHKTFYRSVEATSVTPFSPRALDRALAAALVGVCRHSDPAMTPALGASAIATKRAELDAFALEFAERAENQASGSKDAKKELHDKVLERAKHLLDVWSEIQKSRSNDGVQLQYQDEMRGGGTARLLHDFLAEDLPTPTAAFKKFRANRSMRDVEPAVELRVQAIDEPLT